MIDIEKLQYPIGRFISPAKITNNDIESWTNDMKTLPDRISELCKDLSKEEFNQKYRKGGWTIRQILFHITDSHLHSYIRFKWALTEHRPLIKAYDEVAWAELADAKNIEPQQAIEDIHFIQRKLAHLINNIQAENFNKSFIHPENQQEIRLDYQVGMYAWHGKHHAAHIQAAIQDPVIDYIPIDCGIYDELVLLAMHNTPINLLKNKIHYKEGITIKDLVTENKNEYLILSNDEKIRLDQITSLKGSTLLIVDQ